MTSTSEVAGATQRAAGETASTAKDEAAATASTASTAAGAASDVAGTAKEQATAVAGEAATQVKDLLDQTMTQVNEQAGHATVALGESLRSLSEELRDMGSREGGGPAHELARTVAEKGESLSSYLDGKEPGQLLSDLRSYAGRNPGSFLLGALAAGVVAGRFVRGAKADAADDTSSTASTASTAGAPDATSRSSLPPVTPAPDRITLFGVDAGVDAGVEPVPYGRPL